MTTYFVDLTPDFEVVQLEREDCRYDVEASLFKVCFVDLDLTLGKEERFWGHFRPLLK
jgi:hypothetical protein